MKLTIKRISLSIKQIIHFLTVSLWNLKINEIRGVRGFFYRFLRVNFIAIKGLIDDNLSVRASALTFYSVLSIVPVLAMAFGIAKGFGLEENLTEILTKSLQGQEEVLTMSLEFAHKMLEKTKGGLVAGIGLLVLFFTVMRLLAMVEEAFNSVWYIQNSRSFLRKFTDYLSLIIITPVFIILSSSATLFVVYQINNFTSDAQGVSYISPFIEFLLKVLPTIFIQILLVLIYMIMPNTKVNFKSALIAGLVAGFMFQILQYAYINFQIVVSNYNAVYGSFAALPLFLIWLQISWLIILFGAELSFAYQNTESFEYESDPAKISNYQLEVLSILLTLHCIKRFQTGKPAHTVDSLTDELGISRILVDHTLNKLTEVGILVRIKLETTATLAFQPALSPELITINKVLRTLKKHGIKEVIFPTSDEYLKIKQSLTTFHETTENSPANYLLKNI
jgi:membrane protein